MALQQRQLQRARTSSRGGKVRRPPVEGRHRRKPYLIKKRRYGWVRYRIPHLSRYGYPKAPRNTSSFLIKDSEDREDWRQYHRKRLTDSDDDMCTSPNESDDYARQAFLQEYEDHVNERLQTMPKSELVHEIVRMEEKVEELQKVLQELHTRPHKTIIRPPGFNHDVEAKKIRTFRAEIQKLTVENEYLETENEALRLRLSRLLNST